MIPLRTVHRKMEAKYGMHWMYNIGSMLTPAEKIILRRSEQENRQRQKRKRKHEKPNYLGVYTVERCYGGPEEGGWWYNWYTYIYSVCLDNSSEGRRDRVLADLRQREAHRKHGNIYSVLGGEDMDVLWEMTPGDYASHERPHYE